MVATFEGDELIDVIVRLPRKAIEETLLSAAAAERNVADRRHGQAKALLAGSRSRTACFGGVHFCDPSWEMILQLYVANRENRTFATSQLCSLSGGSVSTALRHIEHLEALGYISRGGDTQDRRRAKVTMLVSLIEATETWLDRQHAAVQVGG